MTRAREENFVEFAMFSPVVQLGSEIGRALRSHFTAATAPW
jgi:hypothetical protein